MMFELLFPLIGIALCTMAFLQLGLWTAQSWLHLSRANREFKLSKEVLREHIESLSGNQQSSEPDTINEEDHDGRWQGFRPFQVASIEKESDLCTSVYLTPEDGKPIADFKPGQHLTFRFDIPGQSKPVVRCYSLSDGPGKSRYRITVKKNLPPHDHPEFPSGVASTYINDVLKPGEVIPVKAPSGSFFLDEDCPKPIVMLAGGIGITPMISMISKIIDSQIERPVVLVYGSRHGADHPFKTRLAQLAAKHPLLHVVNVYSAPRPEDIEGTDYDISGYVSSELLDRLLPHNRFQFYLCGPPPFMESVYSGLTGWGVAESDILFEAFGPASIGRKKPGTEKTERPEQQTTVSFSKSNVNANWTGQHESLLDLAEENGIEIDSGCRAGSCGTCATSIAKGNVRYPEGEKPDCDSGQCLVCIARPDGELELEA